MRHLGKELPTPDEWNRRVDAFDVDALASRVASTGAKYFFLTVGQKSGHYCSPNKRYAELTGIDDGSLSRRDLIADLITAFRPYGVKMMVYLTSSPTEKNPHVLESLGCTPPWDASQWGIKPGSYTMIEGVDDRLSVFQRNWESIYREWSQRWGMAFTAGG